jgi:hypothetical protein
MKLPKLIGATLAIAFGQLVAAHAADLFLVNLRTTCKAFDGDRVVSTRSSTSTILRDYIANQDPSSSNTLRDVRLVYDPEGDRISIVNTGGEILTDVIGFGNSTTSSNSDDSRRERHAFVFLGNNSEAVGSALISERITRDGENNITRLTSHGTFQYGQPAGDTAAQICTGSFSVGKKLVIQEPAPTP